ncbi:hypothetical protein, partial [Paenochrobactrum sp. BZR 201-1]
SYENTLIININDIADIKNSISDNHTNGMVREIKKVDIIDAGENNALNGYETRMKQLSKIYNEAICKN